MATHQSTRDKPHAVFIVAEGRHMSTVTIECNCAVAGGNVKYADSAIAVTNRQLGGIMATG